MKEIDILLQWMEEALACKDYDRYNRMQITLRVLKAAQRNEN